MIQFTRKTIILNLYVPSKLALKICKVKLTNYTQKLIINIINK